jgi:hypothetical protein
MPRITRKSSLHVSSSAEGTLPAPALSHNHRLSFEICYLAVFISLILYCVAGNGSILYAFVNLAVDYYPAIVGSIQGAYIALGVLLVFSIYLLLSFTGAISIAIYCPPPTSICLLIVPKRSREYLIGDLKEEYRTRNKKFARLWYCRQVINVIGHYWWTALRRLAGLDAILKIIRK